MSVICGDEEIYKLKTVTPLQYSTIVHVINSEIDLLKNIGSFIQKKRGKSTLKKILPVSSLSKLDFKDAT